MEEPHVHNTRAKKKEGAGHVLATAVAPPTKPSLAENEDTRLKGTTKRARCR